MESDVTTVTIINGLQADIDTVRSTKTLDLEKRVKMVTALVGRQLQAGALNLTYQRSVGRLAEGSATAVLQLNASPDAATPAGQTKQ